MFLKTNFAALLLSATFIGMAAPDAATAQTVATVAAKNNNSPASASPAAKLPKTLEEFEARLGKKLDPHTALGFYAVIGAYDKARALVRNGVNPDGPLVTPDNPAVSPFNGQAAMGFAALYKSVSGMEFLHGLGVKLTKFNADSLLTQCIGGGFVEGVDFLIRKNLLTERRFLQEAIAELKEDMVSGENPTKIEQHKQILKMLEVHYNKAVAGNQTPSLSSKPS